MKQEALQAAENARRESASLVREMQQQNTSNNDEKNVENLEEFSEEKVLAEDDKVRGTSLSFQ